MKNIFTFLLICFTSLTFSQFPSNLKAYFTFNGNLNDSMGISSPGVSYGATPCADRLGQNNKAYEFDGTGKNIDLSPDLNFGTTTIAFWFKPNNLNASEQLMLSNLSNITQVATTQVEIRVMDVSKIRVLVGSSANAPSSFRIFTCNTIMNTSKWNHVSVVIDNNYTYIKIYINGNLDQDAPITGLTYTKSTGTMRLGTRSYPTNEAPYNGKIDEVMIFNKALTDVEAKSIYTLTNGIKNKYSNLNFSIGPNPISRQDEIKISFGEVLNSSYDIKIFDNSGKEVQYSTRIYNNNLYLKPDHLMEGLYYICLQSEGQFFTKKVMVLN
jgi:hypothetical protein